MSLLRPPSDEIPGDQSSKTPSGKKVPMAMSMMIDSMVRMIQKSKGRNENLNDEELSDNLNDN